MTAKIWNRAVLTVTLGILFIIAVMQIVIDPFWHYHDKLTSLEYPLKDERYMNDGMQRHLEYEILVTGTSMSQNFNASRFETLWGKKTIKTAYSGASYHELSRNIERAIGYNPDLKMVVCSLDTTLLGDDADRMSYEGIPEYLYDRNPFNDVNYWFNKEILLGSTIATLNYTRSGQSTPDFDSYGRFDTYLPCGREAVLGSYTRMDEDDLGLVFTESDKERIRNNIEKNYLALAENNPQVTFLFYLPPYSYCSWDALVRTGQMDYSIEAEKYAVKLLLQQENIQVYGFDKWTDVTTNLDYYMDTLHYNGTICDRITESFYRGEERLTEENYESYFSEVNAIYSTMEYDF